MSVSAYMESAVLMESKAKLKSKGKNQNIETNIVFGKLDTSK